MKPLVFTREGKRIATLTPQEGKAGEVFTLGSAAKCDIVVSAEFGLAPQQVSFSPLGGVWWIGDIAADGRLEINGRKTAAEALVGKASVRVGSFEFEVSSEQSGERKSRRETASDILYAHALSQLSRTFSDSASEDALELEKRVDASLDDILARGLPDFEGLDEATLADLRRETVEDMLRLGPLEPLIADDSITEIMVIDYRHIYVERKGKVALSDRHFRDPGHLIRVIERIVNKVGRRIDESSPLVDARLEDGSRVNAVIPPITPDGACLTIRKFGKSLFTLDKLVSFGSMSPEMMKFIDACVALRKNIVVSGGTGSGKTSLLNAISLCIGPDERIITVEDSLELKLQQSHVVRMEARPANAEGKGEVSIRLLVKNCLRMRPDRIVVGECRGGEALDMLQAMNTGHDGSLTTVHANTPSDTVARLETLCLMARVDHRADRAAFGRLEEDDRDRGGLRA